MLFFLAYNINKSKILLVGLNEMIKNIKNQNMKLKQFKTFMFVI